MTQNYTDDQGCFWEGDEKDHGVQKWYFIEIMGMCGCYSDDLFNDILKTIDAFPENGALYYDKLPIEGPDKYREMILHVMDDKALIEHGSSVRGSWLTDKGKRIQKIIRDNCL